LEADELPAATLTPLSEEVGESYVSIRWSITLKNSVFSNSQIQIYYPRWNPLQGRLAQKMVLSDTPKCTPVLNTVSSITCTYNENTNIMLVKFAFGEEIPGGSIIEFDVDSFRNPYSGKPRDGFWIKTTD